MEFYNTYEFAERLDKVDVLRRFRKKFHLPLMNGKEIIYFTGHSLGLQPKSTLKFIKKELNDWAQLGLDGHFKTENPWFSFHEHFPPKLKKILGCAQDEIIVMNQLTVNLHILLISFYRPDKKRFKIICESNIFPSDLFALESQVRLHKLKPEDVIIKISPRNGEFNIRNEDIVKIISDCGEQLSLVLFGGLNYYTGQLFNIKAITEASHLVGAFCGFDLAHVVGNVELRLHDWNVDFACWCSYKYLNSGPGGVGGAFIHQRHVQNKTINRLAGWWGSDKSTRFQTEKTFDAIPTAEGWQISNGPILSMAAHLASLELFNEAGFENLINKAKLMSAFLIYIIYDINMEINENKIEIITPLDFEEHGCQISITLANNCNFFFDSLINSGVIVDWREPNLIRIAPVPFYNTFVEIYQFGQILKKILDIN